MRTKPMMQFDDAAALQRELHGLAELSGQEFKTALFIAESLRQLGFDPRTGLGGTGVAADLAGAEPGPTIMIRADMDALPFADETDPSKTVAIHACGHDAHSAVVLAIAARMKKKGLKRGRIRFVFQPAEESLQGALGMIKAGVLDGVDIALGAHIRPVQDIPTGTFCAAVRHSASSTFAVRVAGKSAHAARPHLGVNAIEAAASFIDMTAKLRLNPAQTWSVKPTRIECEPGATNSLPAWVKIAFDARAETNPLMDAILQAAKRTAAGVDAAFGSNAAVELIESCPAAEYDETLVDLIRRTIAETFGEAAVARDCGGGGEDFHFYKTAKPELRTAYIGIGAGAAPGLHDRAMHFDESMLPKAVELFEALLAKLL